MNVEKYSATLVGCAVGDALGMPVESWPKARIKKHCGRITEMMDPIILRDENGERLTKDEFGKIHHWTEIFSKGEYTDDTILTLAIAESIIERGILDLYHITQKQLDIFQEFEQGRSKCGFGGTTKAAFANILNGVLPTKSGVKGAPGTGPPMKMAPVGMWMALEPDNVHRHNAGFYFAQQLSRSTHLDSRSVVCGVLQAQAVAECLIGKHQWSGQPIDRKSFIVSLLMAAGEWEGADDLIYGKLRWITRNSDASVEEAHENFGSSFKVHQAYPFVLFMFQKYWDDPIAGLEELVNCGGDCDTTGAMYGALAGARHGMIFPDKWTREIKNLDYLIETGEKLATLEL